MSLAFTGAGRSRSLTSLSHSMACLIPSKETGASKGAVVGIFLYLTFFGFTWLELPWLYPAEINPLKTRTVANAVSTINNWLWNVSPLSLAPASNRR